VALEVHFGICVIQSEAKDPDSFLNPAAHLYFTLGPNLIGPEMNRFVLVLFWPMVTNGLRFPPVAS